MFEDLDRRPTFVPPPGRRFPGDWQEVLRPLGNPNEAREEAIRLLDDANNFQNPLKVQVYAERIWNAADMAEGNGDIGPCKAEAIPAGPFTVIHTTDGHMEFSSMNIECDGDERDPFNTVVEVVEACRWDVQAIVTPSGIQVSPKDGCWVGCVNGQEVQVKMTSTGSVLERLANV